MKIGNLECYGIIYKIENIVNHKVYIGQTTRGFKNRYAGNNKTQPIEWVYNYHKYQNKRKLKGANYHLMKSIENSSIIFKCSFLILSLDENSCKILEYSLSISLS